MKLYNFNKKELINIYEKMVTSRFLDDKMLIMLKQGKSWFHIGASGHEAAQLAASVCFNSDLDYAYPYYRDQAFCLGWGATAQDLLMCFLHKEDDPNSGGRQMPQHYGNKSLNIVSQSSCTGTQYLQAVGTAFGLQRNDNNGVCYVSSGEGTTSEGDFHEAINVAAVWDLPVIFLVENNQWGLSTPSEEQFRFKSFVYKAIGYGIKGNSIDGNNILEVYHEVKKIAEEMRSNPGPFLLECRTFRMRGHEEASGTKYYPEGLQDKWSKKDPVDNYRAFLINKGILSPEMNEEIVEEIKKEISTAFESALAEEPISFSAETELGDRFAAFEQEAVAPAEEQTEMRMVDAISNGLKEAMHKFPELVIMGQDIAEYGGVFKVTDGFINQFGKERVRNTPLCEAAIVGSALGLSVKGYKSVVEMQFADFVTEGFNQIVNNLAKIHWRWGQNADVVIRMPTGAGVGAGPFHSQSNEAWFTHTPGLKVVYPAFPQDAKGLLISAIEDPNPVLFFEHKALYRSVYGQVSEGYFNLPIGKGMRLREGEQLSIITYGQGVHWALGYLDQHPDISADLIDLRSLMPLDEELIYGSVQKTGRAILLQEDCLFGGIASDISAMINEHCFSYLDAPVKRVGSMNTPVPFARELEENFLPKKRFAEAVEEILAY
mgnify:CR=1 FL=1